MQYICFNVWYFCLSFTSFQEVLYLYQASGGSTAYPGIAGWEPGIHPRWDNSPLQDTLYKHLQLAAIYFQEVGGKQQTSKQTEAWSQSPNRGTLELWHNTPAIFTNY